MNLPDNPTDRSQCGPNPGYTDPTEAREWTRCMNAVNDYTWWTWDHILLVVVAVAVVVTAVMLVLLVNNGRKERARDQGA